MTKDTKIQRCPKETTRPNKLNPLDIKEFVSQLSDGDLRGFRRQLGVEINRRAENRSNFSLKPTYKKDSPERFKIYHDLINDDWSHLFCNTDDGFNDYYVYYHCDPRLPLNSAYCLDQEGNEVISQMPFYIGMGRGDRLFNFKRTNQHTTLLSKLISDDFGKKEIAHKIIDGVTKSIALELESKLILYFGCVTRFNLQALTGYEPCLLNNRYEPYPDKYNKNGFSHTKFTGAK